METARVIFDLPQSGARNMATDQALLHTADEVGLITLRLYRWSSPTVSLGYFQTYASREEHEPSRNCELVRRYSGGGAIVHHHELTYSLSVPSRNRWSKQNSELYDLVHQEIIGLLQEQVI